MFDCFQYFVYSLDKKVVEYMPWFDSGNIVFFHSKVFNYCKADWPVQLLHISIVFIVFQADTTVW